MAQRRMFSLEIVSSDAFLDMPVSARELYFQLGMYADDDGFVNPKKIIRMIGSSEDDLKLLLVKKFVLVFENGVMVIKHWKINNYLRNDRYKPTKYLDEKNKLATKENGSYTLGVPKVNQWETQDRIGKDRIGKREGSPSYLKNIPLEDMNMFRGISRATEKQIRDKGEQLFDYCLAKGKQYKNYKAFLTNAIRKDYPIKSDFEEKYTLQ